VLGLQYGPEFCGIARLLVGAREAVGELHCASARSGPYLVPPNLLDSGLQALAVLACLEPSASGAPLVPAAIRSIRIHGALKDRAVCHATLDEPDADGTRTGRVRFYSPEGKAAVDVEGLVLRPSGDALSSRGWARENVYVVTWEPRAAAGVPAAATSLSPAVPGPPAAPWLWIAGSAEAAAAMARALADAGRRDVVATWPPGGPPRSVSGPALDAATGWDAALDRVGAERAVWLTSPLQPQDVPSECERVLDLCRGAVRSICAKLMLATFGAHDEVSPEPAQAALWGLFRTFAREHPDRWGGVVDLPASLRSDAPHAVAAVLESADAEAALRGGALHQPRLQRPPLPAAGDPTFRPDATYLVTGGLGGVGLALADWLHQRGAAHLLLIGRSAPPAEAARAVAALQSRGARVSVLQGDVSKLEDVARALAEPAALGWPAVQGVFHLAGALADAVIQSLDGPRLRVAMAAKISGGWNLHRATATLPLDHFVLFSSIAALGTPGQAGHAAANAFLDALAQRRRASGLPALSLGFGAFAEVGAAARHETGGGRGAPGVLPMPPSRALDAMGTLLSFASAHAVISRTDWKAFAGAVPPGARAFYAPLSQRPAEPTPTADAGKDLPAQLRAQPRRERTEALEQLLQRQIAALLGLSPTQVPGRDQPLMQAGVDSLMAVHLRNALRATLKVDFSVTIVFNNPTIAHLASYIGQLLEASGDPSPEPPADPFESLLAEVENLTDDEVERRLRKGR